MPENDLLLRAARGERTERTPVWMMRQAGRFDPEYRAIREKVNLPLEVMFRTPELAAEISLLPKRFGVDAIIFYQDILTPLAPMGAEFVFRPGPVLERPIRSESDIASLKLFDPACELPFVADTLRRVRESLNGKLPLLGFAGAPLTLAFFLIEGKSPGKSHENARKLMTEKPLIMHRLLKLLADMTTEYLRFQIESGADAVQLFESVGNLLSEEEYREFAHPYHVRVFSRLSDTVPKILFARDQTCVELMADSRANVLSIGSNLKLEDAKNRCDGKVALQGNVDNQLLVTGSREEVAAAVRECVLQGKHQGHILNLSHGILPETPFENGCQFVETCKSTIMED